MLNNYRVRNIFFHCIYYSTAHYIILRLNDISDKPLSIPFYDLYIGLKTPKKCI